MSAFFICTAVSLALWHSPASANILVFPSAVSLAIAPFLWLPFFELVIVLEMVVYKEFFDLDLWLGAHLANILSACIGALPIIVIGAPIEQFLRDLSIGTHFALIVGLMIAAVAIPLINTILEYPILRLFRVPRGLRSFKIIMLTNVGTTIPYLGFFYYASVANR